LQSEAEQVVGQVIPGRHGIKVSLHQGFFLLMRHPAGTEGNFSHGVFFPDDLSQNDYKVLQNLFFCHPE
jgi:hypothetical protein